MKGHKMLLVTLSPCHRHALFLRVLKSYSYAERRQRCSCIMPLRNDHILNGKPMTDFDIHTAMAILSATMPRFEQPLIEAMGSSRAISYMSKVSSRLTCGHAAPRRRLARCSTWAAGRRLACANCWRC